MKQILKPSIFRYSLVLFSLACVSHILKKSRGQNSEVVAACPNTTAWRAWSVSFLELIPSRQKVLISTPAKSMRTFYFITSSARYGPVYAGIPYRNFFVPKFHTGTFQGMLYPFAVFRFSDSVCLFRFYKFTGTSGFPFRARITSNKLKMYVLH